MVSILIVDRNDGNGSNLAKRTAISLNSWARLCGPGDEILHVDCNSPAPQLSLVESIADTLTPEARRYLRCWRIDGPHLTEGLAGNVALQRSNPANPWVISTTGNVVLFPRKATTLAQALRELPPACYVCPGTAIPDETWRYLNRASVEEIEALGRRMIGDGTTFPPHPAGDFLLAPRDHWLAIRGHAEAPAARETCAIDAARRLGKLTAAGQPSVLDAFCALRLGEAPTNAEPTVETLSPQEANPENWGLRDRELPLIPLDKIGRATPEEILSSTQRPGFVHRLLKRLSK